MSKRPRSRKMASVVPCAGRCFYFLQGGDSVFGRLLSDAGVDVDALREKISNFFSEQNNSEKMPLIV